MKTNGNALYQYFGCYQDTINFRIEAKDYRNPNVNTNGLCQNQSYAAGAVFDGTEHTVECWVGNVTPNPNLKVSDALCNYQRAGDNTQVSLLLSVLRSYFTNLMGRSAVAMVATRPSLMIRVATPCEWYHYRHFRKRSSTCTNNWKLQLSGMLWVFLFPSR